MTRWINDNTSNWQPVLHTKYECMHVTDSSTPEEQYDGDVSELDTCSWCAGEYDTKESRVCTYCGDEIDRYPDHLPCEASP